MIFVLGEIGRIILALGMGEKISLEGLVFPPEGARKLLDKPAAEGAVAVDFGGGGGFLGMMEYIPVGFTDKKVEVSLALAVQGGLGAGVRFLMRK